MILATETCGAWQRSWTTRFGDLLPARDTVPGTPVSGPADYRPSAPERFRAGGGGIASCHGAVDNGFFVYSDYSVLLGTSNFLLSKSTFVVGHHR